jgi:hypothetical protein
LSEQLKEVKEYLIPLTETGWLDLILNNSNISKVLKYPRFKTFKSKFVTKKRKLKAHAASVVSSNQGTGTGTHVIVGTGAGAGNVGSGSGTGTGSFGGGGGRGRGVLSSSSQTGTDKCILRQVIESIDLNLMTVCNGLLKEFGDGDESWFFKKKEYDMVIDIEQTIEVLGGLRVISMEPSKVKALARLIQSDPSDLEVEIQFCLQGGAAAAGGGSGQGQGTGVASGRNSRPQKSWIRRCFCCFESKRDENGTGLKTSLLSSEENYEQESAGNSCSNRDRDRDQIRSPPSVRWGDEIDLQQETKESTSRRAAAADDDLYKPRETSVVSGDGVSLRFVPK